MEKDKIAALGASIDPLCLPESDRKNVFIITAENSTLHNYLKKTYPEKNILVTRGRVGSMAAIEDFVKNTDLEKQMSARGITRIIVPHSSSKTLYTWAKRRKIKLLGVPHALQELLENKIYFDRKIKKAGIRSPKTYNGEATGKKAEIYVVQKAKSYGGFGTKFVRADSVAAYANKKNMLVREYVRGTPFGISICVNKKGEGILSSVRQQCFAKKNGLPGAFLGIQWTPWKNLPRGAGKEIEKMAKKCLKLLKDEKFVGIANIDFICSGKKIFVLECNPRFSSATPHILLYPELVGNKNIWRILLNAWLEKNEKLRKNKIKIPRTTHNGSVWDIDLEKTQKTQKTLPIGVFELEKKGEIRYKSSNPAILRSQKKRFLLIHELREGEYVKKGETLCSIIANFAMFDKKGRPKKEGEKIIARIKKSFLKQP